MDSDRYLNDFEERIESLIDEEGIFQICDDKKKPEILTSGKVNKGSNDSVHCDKDEIYSSPSNIHQSKNLVHPKDVLISNNESARFHETKKMPEKLIPGKSVLNTGTSSAKIEINNNSIIDVPPILRQEKGTNMSNDSGFIQIPRELFFEDDWNNLSPRYRCVFMTILGLVNYKSRMFDDFGKDIEIGPGQICISIRRLVEKCSHKDIDHNIVFRSLMKFEKIKYSRHEVRHKTCIITITHPGICKYLIKESETTYETKMRQERDTKEERKKDINKNIPSSSLVTPTPKKKEERNFFKKKEDGKNAEGKILICHEIYLWPQGLNICIEKHGSQEKIVEIVNLILISYKIDEVDDWVNLIVAWRKIKNMEDFTKENEILGKKYEEEFKNHPGWSCEICKVNEKKGIVFDVRGIAAAPHAIFFAFEHKNFEKEIEQFISNKKMRMPK